MQQIRFLLLVCGSLCFPSWGWGDEFTYLDTEKGAFVTQEARLHASGQGFQVLELANGMLEFVPTAAITNRVPKDGPEPIQVDGMVEFLKERFGADLVRLEVDKTFVVGLVMSAPLEKSAEARASAFVKKGLRFMKNVDNVFMKYARSMKFPLRESKFPHVLLIFESDEDFNEYADAATGGQGLTASSILGFYAATTNWLAIRMSSCDSFEVPLHEAIHQMMYNRVFQRLTPVPKWFDEGIATGFEGNGERIDVHPAKINSRYAAAISRMSGTVDWSEIIARDRAFTADVLAGDAYVLAWCLHWMLVTQHRDAYQNYVQQLSQREPLAVVRDDERVEEFEKALKVSVQTLQQNFPNTLQMNVRRQKVNLQPKATVGRASQQQALGEYDVQAVRRMDLDGSLHVGGSLKNISPLRTMSFYVTVETESGAYADWLLPTVKPGERLQLQQQAAAKVIPGSPGGPGSTFRVNVRSVPAESDAAKRWQSGQVPGPVSGR